MTTKAIEAGARAIYEATPRNKPYSLLTKHKRNALEAEAKACIEAALSSGELVPESAVAAERERWAKAVRDERLEYMITQDDHSYNHALDHAEQAIRALSPEPASGEFVVGKPRPDDCARPIQCGWRHVKTEPEINLWLCDVPGCSHMLDAATKDGERA